MVVNPWPDLIRAPGVKVLANRGGIGAVLVDELQQMPGLQQGSGETAAEGRGGGGHGIAEEDESRQRQPPVVSGLTTVGVEQGSAGEHGADRPGAGGIRPVGQARNGLGGGGGGRRVGGVGQGPGPAGGGG